MLYKNSSAKITGLIHRITSYFPNLKRDLRIAHSKYTPNEFIKSGIKTSLVYSSLLTILFFFVLDKAKLPNYLLIPSFLVFFVLLFQYNFLKLKAQIKRREREINTEVLFAGRYLLIKIYSGRSLLNALAETSKSYGIASKYFKEIIDDVDTGKPIEKALEDAVNYSPSEKFSKILFQVANALKLGIDVTKPLESVIEEISAEQELEVTKYGKKLNTIVIFYMLLAVVLPSIGTTMLIVISSFLNVTIGLREFFALVFIIIIIQFIFISMFKSIRPEVNL